MFRRVRVVPNFRVRKWGEQRKIGFGSFRS